MTLEDKLHGQCPGGPIGEDLSATCPHCNMTRVALESVRFMSADIDRVREEAGYLLGVLEF